MRPFKRPPTLLPHCTQCLQRTFSTTATAPAPAHRKLRNDGRGALRELNEELNVRSAILRTRVRAARVARREDWILGPLAPRRDDPGFGEYGTVEARELKGPGVRGGKGKGKKGMRMRWEESLIYEGDRVVVVAVGGGGQGPEGRDVGRIGTVVEVRRELREVVVEDLNMVDVKSGDPFEPEANNPRIQSVPHPIPLSSIRLVHRIADPYTGVETDKIISRLIPFPEEKKAEIRAESRAENIGRREMQHRLAGRTIPGSNEVYGNWLEIPLPRPVADKEIASEYDSDTLRYEVEETTWTPTLVSAPMPGGVIDELRNKYSRFRTRHDAGYQLALDNRARRKAEYKAWVESGGSMSMTPTKEASRVEKEKLKEKGEPRLEKEVLERIGEVMARQGVEMTGKRRREMERNLSREGVVKWGADVEIPEKKRGERVVLGEEDEYEDEDEDDDEDDDDEERENEEEKSRAEEGDVVIEEDRPKGEKRPTL
ncbi:MAG: hypothetical protein Q9161_006952 [Pseudevernia consocians]